jgi:anti-sigma regulatory factor (Ser/Thr protein kinase)
MSENGILFSRTIPSRLEAIASLADEIESWAEANGVQQKLINSVNLMLDEVISNIVKYGYKHQPTGQIELRVELVGKTIEAIVRDYGPPFNLLEASDPDVSRSLDARAPGGLGIYLIRQLADEIVYRRDGQANEVTLRKSAS